MTPLVLALLGQSPGIELLNRLLAQNLPAINALAVSEIPASYGDCGSHGPPMPCDNVGDLYTVHKHWEYKAVARWITGLKSLNLSSIVFSQVNGSASTGTSVLLSARGLFGDLPASLYIGECFTFDQCSVLWDNTHGCCGSNKHFELQAAAVCSPPPPAAAELVAAAQRWTKVTDSRGRDGACALHNGSAVPALQSVEADLEGCQQACSSGLFGDCAAISFERNCQGTRCDCVLDARPSNPIASAAHAAWPGYECWALNGPVGSAVSATPVSAASVGAGPSPVDHLAVGDVTLDKLEITEKIIGIKIHVADITDAVEEQVKGVMKKFLIDDASMPGPNGTHLTLLQWLNSEPVAVAALTALCSAGTY